MSLPVLFVRCKINLERGRWCLSPVSAGPRYLLSTTRLPGTMDDLNPADFTALQPYLNPVRVKRGLREQVLDDASGLFPCGLVLFEDN